MRPKLIRVGAAYYNLDHVVRVAFLGAEPNQPAPLEAEQAVIQTTDGRQYIVSDSLVVQQLASDLDALAVEPEQFLVESGGRPAVPTYTLPLGG